MKEITPVFVKTNILLPDPDTVSYPLWSTIACDQYTSQSAYWDRVSQKTAHVPSTLHITFPEIYLHEDGFHSRIQQINQNMRQYLKDGIFINRPDSLFYIERTMCDGTVRKGVVGAIDLEAYDYQKGACLPVRATEGTVLDRIPPRVKIREGAPLETPHIMLLIDDAACNIIERLSGSAQQYENLYDFDLMEAGGHIRGYCLDDVTADAVVAQIAALGQADAFAKRYGVSGKPSLLFAAGDGNHSLATAKQCYENLKAQDREKALASPKRFALCEVVNLHSPALAFEAIHRVVFGADYAGLMERMAAFFANQGFCLSQIETAQSFTVVSKDALQPVSLQNPNYQLSVASLQAFLDQYVAEQHLKIDYIHGDDVVKQLCASGENVGFLLPSMQKDELFPTVILDGALPRKTFSMGKACEKRYYLECRRLED